MNSRTDDTRSLRHYLWISALLGLLLLCAVGAGANGVLPGVDEIIAQYIKACGGRAAIEKLYNCKMTGTFSIPSMGVEAELIEYQAVPRFASTVINSMALGKIESGCDGEIFWESSSMHGARILKGESRTIAYREYTFNAVFYWRELFDKVEVLGIADVNGEKCYKIVSTPVEGSPVYSYFSTSSFLLIKSELSVCSDRGDITIDSYAGDYRNIDDVLVPFRTRAIIMGMQEIVQEYDRIEFNVQLPEGIFDLPQEILALRDM
ncbi:MAG: outer membrane lipoprotein-sorting protein [bacterium]|nr:outer membrane lipoprotein-sorting protein [bacterium]